MLLNLTSGSNCANTFGFLLTKYQPVITHAVVVLFCNFTVLNRILKLMLHPFAVGDLVF